MANNFPCDKKPKQFINCCQVMDCVDIKSSDNSISVEKSECGIDLTMTGNNVGEVLQINPGTCIEFIKEYIDGKLVLTPVIDWTCVAGQICGLCPPIDPPTSCPQPLSLSVVLV